MSNHSKIPRRIVRTNQWFIVISVLISWVTGAYWLLLLPLISGVLSVYFHYNPVGQVAALFLKKNPQEYTLEDADQQKFNQTIANLLLLVGVISSWLNWTVLLYASTVMVAAAAFIAILGFCVGCFIRYQWLQYKYRKSQKI